MSDDRVTKPEKRAKRLRSLNTYYKKRSIYNILAAMEYLLDESKSAELRALKLYELLAAIHFTFPSKGKRSIDEFGNGYEVPVYKTPFNRARLAAAMQLMDHLAQPDPNRKGGRKLPLSLRALKVPFMEIYDEFGKFGGWKEACRVGQPKGKQGRFKKEASKLTIAGAVLEFSLHATPEQIKKTEKRRITTAFRVLGAEGHLKKLAGEAVSEEVLRDRWRDARCVAIFGHLIYYVKIIPDLDVTKPDFAEKLLACTRTTEMAKKILVTYNELQRRLYPMTYVYPRLALPISVPTPACDIRASEGISKIPARS